LSASLDLLPKRHSRFYTVNWLETWTHRFGPMTSGSVGAGATYVQSRTSGAGSTDRGVNAAGALGIGHGIKLPRGAALGLSAGAGLSTNYNPVLGTVTQGIGAGATVSWSRKQLSLSVGAQAGQGLPVDAPGSFRSYGANAGAHYQLAEPIALQAGANWTHQVLPAAALANNAEPNSWSASLSISLTAPPIVF
jgi:hypothetical protein